jgi:HD-like signal output (HDOD) protein
MKSILFVDDEPHILQGLQRMLRPMRREWEMAFASSGQEALDLMARRPFDIIVSDMRMPGMDGATLLSRVMERYPQTVRLALSGQSDKETIFRSVGPTHQFLSKPCDADLLKETVNRAFALRELMGNRALERVISRVKCLPSLPQAYEELLRELQSPEASLAGVARIIEGDVAMTAKILQYVNSAFFGIRQHVTNPAQAVSLLGLDVIRSLVLMVGVFAQIDASRLPPQFRLDSFSQHSLAVGAQARTVCKCLGRDDRDISDSFTAGVLHDAGMLVLAADFAEEYARVLARVARERVPLEQAELDAFGASHAEIGGYLLGLWGFPDPVVEAIAFHPWPSRCVSRAFGPLTAVHVANAFAHRQGQAAPGATPGVDVEYLRECGLDGRLAEWEAACVRGPWEAPV